MAASDIINDDKTLRVVLNTEEIDWVASPQPGVFRRRLERNGGEVARATSIVKYDEGSSFPHHVHGGGEEYLVLEGVFYDDSGVFPKRTYVRNPPSSSHAPWTTEGCILLVKLCQMQPNGEKPVVIQIDKENFEETHDEGVQRLNLYSNEFEEVYILKLRSNSTMKKQIYSKGIELFVLEGTLSDEFGKYEKGFWVRNPKGFESTLASNDNGCLVWVKSNHIF